ncbi:copper resistance CopC family protein [Alkalihalobacillus sp. BA299]|uniref:copper resistance CopC family protein n=1 Tax=Alkalihalobacillus sp. BA299 TaxID=2815938 RepID=UPI001ADC1951|nr:copper resistance CopC family protein [Alkalihalobacillus sp. BA299]
MNKWFPVLLCALFIFFSIPSLVEAHAYLDRSSPVQESRLDKSPSEIRVKFTEPIDTNVSLLTLKTEDGEVIETTQYGEDRTWLILDIPHLEDGIYRVYWQAFSLDTHITDGSFRFSIGVDLPELRPAETISIDEAMKELQAGEQVGERSAFNWNTLFRTLDLLAALAITGLFFFTRIMINEKSIPHWKGQITKRFEQIIYRSALVVFIISGIGNLFIRAVQ